MKERTVANIKLGVLGGMGPAASAEFMRLLAAPIFRTGAVLYWAKGLTLHLK
jgi:aspartate/glutamate racemase